MLIRDCNRNSRKGGWRFQTLLLGFLSVCPCSLFGQTGVVSLNTGSGQVLVSELRTVSVNAGLVRPAAEFSFGFGTDEALEPNLFLDSFTITAQDQTGSPTALFLTIDANKLEIAPPSSGTLGLDPSGIRAYDSSYPALVPVPAQRRGFQARILLPEEFAGKSVQFFFDLFDNLDNQASQAWFTDPKIVGAPELILTPLGTNKLQISWASPSTGFVLQRNANLAATNWVDVAQTVQDDGVLKSVGVDPSVGAMFFRLKQE